MKKLSYLLIIIVYLIYVIFITRIDNIHEVLEIYSPTTFGVDINNDKQIRGNEILVIENIESFSTHPSKNALNKYTKSLNISEEEYLKLGYLAEEFTQQFLHKKVYVKRNKDNPEIAIIKIDGNDYVKILENSGYALKDGRVLNEEKFEGNRKKAQKLDLAAYNKYSNKYHKINCKFAKQASQQIIIPHNQLPKDAIPCSYCIKHKHKNKNKNPNTINLIPPKQTITDGDIKLFYTNYTKHLTPNKDCSIIEYRELVNNINRSKSTIDIAIYGYSNIPKITTALKNAKDRGVKIRYIYDSAFPAENNIYQDNQIIKNLAYRIQTDTDNKIMHNKFLIFDNETVFTGSMNISPTGLSGYDENNTIIIKSKEIAQVYTAEFEQMLRGDFHQNITPQKDKPKYVIGKSKIEIYFSPQDKTSIRIIELIDNANEYIYIPAYLITHKGITQALINAHKRGIDIKIILDANNCAMKKSTHKQLRGAGIQVKIENYAGKLHSKTMIIDNKYLVIGSMNFSNSGENKNDENTLIIENQDFAKNYRNFFLYLWKVIPDKYLKKAPLAESHESIGSCTDGIDNNFNGLTDSQEKTCK